MGVQTEIRTENAKKGCLCFGERLFSGAYTILLKADIKF